MRSITGAGLPVASGLCAIDILLAFQIGGGHVLGLHIAGIAGCNVHRDVLEQLLEVLGARHKVALAIQFEQHADLAAGMNICATPRPRWWCGPAFFCAEAMPRLRRALQSASSMCPIRLLQGFQAVAHGRSGLLAKLLHQLGINFLRSLWSSLFSCFPASLPMVHAAGFPA
jgi:hypothetical protein